MSVLRLYAVLSLAGGLVHAQDAAGLLDKLSQQTRSLHAYHVTATIRLAARQGGQTVSSEAVLDASISADAEKVNLAYKSGKAALVVVSDGATTWTYLPDRHRYMKVEAATLASEEGEDEDTNLAFDSLDVVVRKFGGLDQLKSAATLAGEETLSTPNGKIPCWVILCRLPGRTEKVWIDKERMLALRAETIIGSGEDRMEVAMRVTQFDLAAPAESVFTFTPPRGAKLVDELPLPGQHHHSLVGHMAADFELKDLSGQPVKLSGLRGKVVVLSFWATWCGPCRSELPTVDRLASQWKDKGVVILGVNDEDPKLVRRFNEKNRLTFTTVSDVQGKVHHAYGTRSIPTMLVVDKRGVVVRQMVGARDEDQLRQAIESAM